MIMRSILLVLLGLAGAATATAQTGDLTRRLLLNYDRLERPDFYSATRILARMDQDGAPGELAGRAILAWSVLAEATGRPPRELLALRRGLPAHFNAQGCLGPPLNPDALDEAQLAGHGWLIAGLCRASAATSDSRELAWVRVMIDGLALPLKGKFAQYPRTAAARPAPAATTGTLAGPVVNGWRLTAHGGDAFMFLEGLVPADRALPSPALEQVIEEAGETFLALDLPGVKARTQPALCAARNLLLYERAHPLRQGWLPKIEAIYKLYRERAMTENDAALGGFEPAAAPATDTCATVEAFLLALELWRATGKESYLNEAHAIFYNGLGYGQKSHGGFGDDAIISLGDKGLALDTATWDLTDCCNLSGAVGLAAAARACTEVRENTLLLPFYAAGTFKGGGWRVSEQTGWPCQGEVTLQLDRDAATSAGAALRQVGFFVPAGVAREKVKLAVNGKAAAGQWARGFLTAALPKGDACQVRLTMEIPLRLEKPQCAATRKDWVSVRYGYLMLGTPAGQQVASLSLADLKDQGDGRFGVQGTSLVLEPLCRMPFTGATKTKPWQTQILFVPKK